MVKPMDALESAQQSKLGTLKHETLKHELGIFETLKYEVRT